MGGLRGPPCTQSLNPELLHGLLGLGFRLRVLAGLVQRLGVLGQLPGAEAGVVETVTRLVVHLLDELRTLERRRRPGDGEEQRESDTDRECNTPHRCDSFRLRDEIRHCSTGKAGARRGGVRTIESSRAWRWRRRAPPGGPVGGLTPGGGSPPLPPAPRPAYTTRDRPWASPAGRPAAAA